MSAIEQSLLFTNVILIIVGLGFAFALWFQHRTNLHRIYLYSWLSRMLVFFGQGLAGDNANLAILLLSILSFEIFYSVGLYANLFDVKVNQNRNLIIMVGSILLSIVSLPTDLPTWMKALPMCVGYGWVAINFCWRVKAARKMVSLEEKIFISVFFAHGVHILDFPWLRFAAYGYTLGFSLSIILTYAASMLTPMIIAARMKRNYSDMLEAEVRFKTEQLRQALEDKKDLMKILSHDFAGLLGISYSYTDLALRSIKENRPPQAIEGLLEKSWNAIKSEVELMQFVRRFGVLEHDEAGIPLQPVSLVETIERCRNIFADSLQKKNLLLVYDPDSMKDLLVLAEPTTLCHSVISNLLSNAIKFSPPGGRIWMTAEKTAGNNVLVAVRDEGTGVPMEVIDNLFKSKTPTSLSRPGTEGEPGSGLGLILVKKTLDKYGADLKIVTSGDHPELLKTEPGTTFFIYFKEALTD